MDLRCASCNSAYDRANHIPHFIPCGCDICSSCVQKFVYRSSSQPAAINTTSHPNSRKSSVAVGGGGAASSSASVAPLVVNQPYRCPRGHITPANVINNCQPMVAHRIAEQVRDVSQTCPLHQRRPMDFFCIPCRKALCGACAIAHREESGCLLPARPIQQCTGEILKLAYECKGQLDNSARAVENCQLATSRLLKAGGQVPVDLMNNCLTAVEQFHNRLLKSVDTVWRDHMNELKNVKRAHQALNDVHTILDGYKEKVIQGEKLCDETDAATRTVDPLPLAATMAEIEADQVLTYPLKLFMLRGVESVTLDPSGATLSASWQEPFHGKGEFIPFGGLTTSEGGAAAAMLDRASSPQNGGRRYGSASRKQFSPQVHSPLAGVKNAQVNVDGTPQGYRSDESSSQARGHTPLGLFSVTDILNMGPNRKSLEGPLPAVLSERREQQQQQQQQQGGGGGGSRGGTPKMRVSPKREPYVQVRNFNPVASSGQQQNQQQQNDLNASVGRSRGSSGRR